MNNLEFQIEEIGGDTTFSKQVNVPEDEETPLEKVGALNLDTPEGEAAYWEAVNEEVYGLKKEDTVGILGNGVDIYAQRDFDKLLSFDTDNDTETRAEAAIGARLDVSGGEIDVYGGARIIHEDTSDDETGHKIGVLAEVKGSTQNGASAYVGATRSYDAPVESREAGEVRQWDVTAAVGASLDDGGMRTVLHGSYSEYLDGDKNPQSGLGYVFAEAAIGSRADEVGHAARVGVGKELNLDGQSTGVSVEAYVGVGDQSLLDQKSIIGAHAESDDSFSGGIRLTNSF